jgi:glutamine amidotransferase
MGALPSDSPLSTADRRARIAVVDYGAANMVSITKALAAVGAEVSVAVDAAGFENVDAIVVPGVGAARAAMVQLQAQGLRQPILDWARAGRPLLGICLGLQVLFEASDEGDAEALGILAGRTVGLVDAPTLPHIGWNSVFVRRPHPIFDGVPNCSHFYFVHSYAPVPADESIVLGQTCHGRPFVSAVAQGHVVGLQFHPEKSSDAGLQVLSNFVAMVEALRDGRPLPAGGSVSAESWSDCSPEVC